MEAKTKKIGDYSYDMNKVIGKGCFGEVFIGWHNARPEQKLAIKKVERRWIEENDVLKNCFTSELNILRKLDNENVIKFVSFVQTERSYYLVTEYIDGGTLEDMIKKEAIPEKECLRFLRDMLNGWRSLIKLGVVHRDIKPENILIHNKVYKIADFGFAKSIEYHLSKMHQTRLGSPYFMAPQIHLNQPYTSKCDIWSLGVILFRMLFREYPWQAMLSTGKSHIDIYREQPPLVLPRPIEHPNFHDFLARCLSIPEEGRLTWR
jgi:serine/threonine-protein kinase ULK/ATG1